MDKKVHSREGFTLIELLVVVALLAAIALMAVTKTGQMVRNAKITAAESDIKHLADAFLNADNGYIANMRGIAGFSVGYLRVANLLISTNLYGSAKIGDDLYAGVRVDGALQIDGCAPQAEFVHWNDDAGRGWNGPYIRHATGSFPNSSARRFEDDATSEERGFFPPLAGLKEPQDFIEQRNGCSIYGFPGEPTVMDPWGNPYVLQIPPAQAFEGGYTNLPDEVRFRYARIVSAGPDGRLQTPCFAVNLTNRWETSWTERTRKMSRQAGLDDEDRTARGDDLVWFLMREDVDEKRLHLD